MGELVESSPSTYNETVLAELEVINCAKELGPTVPEPVSPRFVTHVKLTTKALGLYTNHNWVVSST